MAIAGPSCTGASLSSEQQGAKHEPAREAREDGEGPPPPPPAAAPAAAAAPSAAYGQEGPGPGPGPCLAPPLEAHARGVQELVLAHTLELWAASLFKHAGSSSSPCAGPATGQQPATVNTPGQQVPGVLAYCLAVAERQEGL